MAGADLKSPFQPLNDDHAIERVLFSLQFNELFSAPLLAKIRQQHALWADDLPAVREPAGFVFVVDPSRGPQIEPSAGLEFCVFRPDGSTVWSLQLRAAEAIVECTRYTRWERVSAFAFRQLERMLPIVLSETGLRPVKASMVVQDAFRTASGEGDVSALLRPASNLPSSVFNRGPSWHCHLGWFEPDSDGVQVLVQLNLDAVLEGEPSGEQRNRVSLTNAQFVDYPQDGVRDAPEILSWFAKRMDALHRRNKDLLLSLLQEQFVEQIGLKNGASQ